MASTSSPRNELIDALRALALLPVFAVNFSSFIYGYDTSSLGLTTPQGDWLAIASVWLISALMQNKGVVLLAFLVGVSLVLSSRASARRGLSASQFAAAQSHRLGKQALLGVAHGVLLYFGDILLTYAAAGFVLLKLHRMKLKRLLQIAFALFALNVLINLSSAVSEIHDLLNNADAWDLSDAPSSIANAMTWSEVWLSNIDQWTLGTTSQLFIVPLLAMPPMLLGVVAARLQWLTHARWQAQRARFAKRLLPIAFILNGCAATLYAWSIDLRVKELENLATSLMSFAGPVAVAWFVCWVSNLYSKQIIRSCGQLISPLGRYSLSSYLLGSIVMNGLFAGAGLALPTSSALLLVLAIAFWCVCLWLANVATKRGWQGLPERWLSVRSHETKQIN